MKNKLSTYSFIFTLIVISCTIFILPDNKITHLIFLGTLSFIFGLYISVDASKKKCKKVGKLRSLFHGLLTTLTSTSIYALLSYMPVINTPIEMVIKNKTIAKYIGSVVYIFIVMMWVVKRNHKNSIEKVCSLCHNEMNNNLKKYNEYLNKIPESPRTNIEIRE